MQKRLLGILVGLTFAGAASADEWVVEAHFTDQAALQRAARHFDHVIVDRKHQTLRVETSDKGIAALEAEGLAVTIDTAATARLTAANERVAAVRERLAHEGKSKVINGSGYDSIPGYECFRTVEGTYATMDDLVAAHPDIASIDEIGPTWKKTQDSTQGYEMRAMHITNLATLADDPDRPKFAVYFSIHAREYTPAEIGTRFAEWLVDNYGTDPEATWLVDHDDFHLILMANPDARKEAEQQIYHRKNMDDTYGGINQCGDDEFSQFGIDLNRNFPFHWNITLGQGSDDDVCSQTYHGPYADGTPHNEHIQGDVEPETQNLFSYVAGTCDSDGNCTGGLFGDHRDGPMDPQDTSDDPGDAAPDDTSGVFIDMHSNAALVLWPWGDTSTDSPNVTSLTTFGRRIAYFNGYTPEQSNELYLTDGTTDDSMYGLLGVAAYTIETNGFDFFEDCDTFEGNTAPTNLDALRYVSRALHAPYQLPAGPDTIDVGVSSDLVVIGDVVTLTAHIDSSRFNQSNGSQPVNDIAGAKISFGDLPWNVAVTQPMDAADGAFDSPVETAVATVPIGGGSGRLFLFVQGTDSEGHAGTPNAAYVDVTDLGKVGTVFGEVTDHASGDPLGASIVLHNPDNGETHHAISDPLTGNYTAHGYPGTFDVTASAPRHIPQTVSLALTALQKNPHDFSLLSDCPFFDDDVENGGALWTTQSPWVIANNVPGNATHVWNTPNYGDGIDRSLTTASSYDLTGYTGATLDFDDRCDTESGYDFGYVEFSTNDGGTWSQLYSCSGQSSWQSHHLELPSSADGASAVKVRFRLHSDDFQNAPGWAVDNIRFAAGGNACIAQQTNDEIFANGFEP